MAREELRPRTTSGSDAEACADGYECLALAGFGTLAVADVEGSSVRVSRG